MNRFWFKFAASFVLSVCLGAAIFSLPYRAEALQIASTPSGVTVTVTYTDPMNVRSGPGTFYDIIGQLFPGDVRSAIGISPGREWIEISYEGGAGGIGWVYATYVSVSGGDLPVVESPPTPTPLFTNTVDPTLAAAFHLTPTETRLPTFTPPPPVTVPAFQPGNMPGKTGIPTGYFIIFLGVIGAIGLAASLFSRR